MALEPAPRTESPHWYRVERLRPVLREHVRVHRHHYRGSRWYVLQDAATGRHHRVSAAAYQLIARFDGRRALGELWRDAQESSAESPPAQAELIALLGQLHAADLLRCEVSPDALELFSRHTRAQHKGFVERLANPLYLRIPLWDPDRFLEALVPYARPLVGRAGLLVWLAVVACGALLALAHARELAAVELARVLDPSGLPLLVFAYVVVKLCHELGHALATRLGGGEVHELGLVFLVLFPNPYVDASSASGFPDKRWRMLVGAAGVGVELFLAALAVGVFCSVGPGVLRTFAHHVVLIAGLSSLVFNGNPFLRFDGYYVLADALELPNLAQRARERLAALFTQHVLGLPERRGTSLAPGEARCLAAYGVLAFVARLSVTLATALLLARRYEWLGLAVALWGMTFVVVVPALRGLARLRADPRLPGRTTRAVTALAGAALLVVLLLFALPLPLTTRSEGVLWVPENAQVRSGADGFVVRVVAAPGAEVRAGEVLIETRDPDVEARIAVLAARLRELRQRADELRVGARVKAGIADDEARALEVELVRERARAAQARVVAPSAGRFVLPRAEDLPGRFVRRGQTLGWVAGELRPIVRTVVTEDEIAAVRSRTRRVDVRLLEQPGVTWPALIRREIPAASHRLPSLALGAAGGGRLAVDTRDPEGMTSVAKFFSVELELPVDAATGRIGGRARVRFEHDGEALYARLARALRRLFLRELRA